MLLRTLTDSMFNNQKIIKIFLTIRLCYIDKTHMTLKHHMDFKTTIRGIEKYDFFFCFLLDFIILLDSFQNINLYS